MEKEITFVYKPKWKSLALAIVFFTVCAIALFHKASNNDRGLIIEEIIKLSVSSATIFYYVLSAFAAIGVIFGTLGIVSSRNPKYLVFTEIRIPPVGIQKKESVIPIKEIISLNETNISGQVMLYIKTKQNKAVIQRSMLENKAVYEQVKKLINDLIALN